MSVIDDAMNKAVDWISDKFKEMGIGKDEPSKPNNPLPLSETIHRETQVFLTPLQRLTIASSSPFSGFPGEASCKIDRIIEIFQELNKNIKLHLDSPYVIKEFKRDIIIIKIRIKHLDETYGKIDDDKKTFILNEIAKFRLLIKEEKPSDLSKISVNIHSDLIPLIDCQALLASYFEPQYIQTNGLLQLTFSDQLKKRLTDAGLEQILQKIPTSTLESVTYFDFRDHPTLSSKSVGILLRFCPNLSRTTFQNIFCDQFFDYLLKTPDGKLQVNQFFLARTFLCLEKLITNDMCKGVIELPEAEAASIKDCFHAAIGLYDVTKETDIKRAVKFLHHLLLLGQKDFQDHTKASILLMLKTMRSNKQNWSDTIQQIDPVLYFQEYLQKPTLDHLKRLLQLIDESSSPPKIPEAISGTFSLDSLSQDKTLFKSKNSNSFISSISVEKTENDGFNVSISISPTPENEDELVDYLRNTCLSNRVINNQLTFLISSNTKEIAAFMSFIIKNNSFEKKEAHYLPYLGTHKKWFPYPIPSESQ